MDIIAGSILGFASGIGLGGGSLVVLWLNFRANLDQRIIRMVNLLFFLSSASIACYINVRKKSIPWKKILPGIAAGTFAAGICSLISSRIHDEIIRTMFGILLISAGLQQLAFHPKK